MDRPLLIRSLHIVSLRFPTRLLPISHFQFSSHPVQLEAPESCWYLQTCRLAAYILAPSETAAALLVCCSSSHIPYHTTFFPAGVVISFTATSRSACLSQSYVDFNQVSSIFPPENLPSLCHPTIVKFWPVCFRDSC